VRRKTLLLARDRFGIKPLFYAPGRQRFAFASEINALREIPGIDLQPNRQAMYDFAALSFIPAPETFYTGIKALQPGELIIAQCLDEGIEWHTHTYHRWSIPTAPCLSIEEAVERTDALLTTAVQRQLESDVPLGTLLSGGIDSSLISALAQKTFKDELQSFNVRFGEEEYDETWAAVAVARHIGSRHKTLDMDEVPGSWTHITDLLKHVGQPFADTSLFGVHRVCQMIRRYVKVALSGDGGDEGFGGYDLYWRIVKLVRLQQLPEFAWHGASTVLPLLTRFGIVPKRYPRRLQALSGTDNTRVIQNLCCWVSEEELRNFCWDQKCLPVRRFFEPQWEHGLAPGASRLEQLFRHMAEVNVRLNLANDFLFKVDIASMKESLEVRVPMLDEELFAFGLSLPPHLKVKGRTRKRVLRAVAQRQLPPAVANKPKRGFGVPVDNWVDAEFKARVRETLLGTSSRVAEFYRPEAYRPIVEAFYNGHLCRDLSRSDIYNRVIQLLAAELALGGTSVHGPHWSPP